VNPGTVIQPQKATKLCSSASALIEVGTDHRLANPEPLAVMLWECDGQAKRQ
jgi:hypothetical protein